MTIRHASAADLPRIVEIYNETIPGRGSTADLEPVTVEQRRAWFERHNPQRRPLLVRECDGSLVAWLSLDDYKERAAYSITAEVSVYVAAEHRRSGHARALMSHALDAAPGLGIEVLLAIVFDHNEASIALFEGFGFARWGLLRGVTRLDGRLADVAMLGLRLR